MARTTDSSARDYDETRRLLYMALVAGRTKKYNLAGTLINALRHHQGIDDTDLEDRVIAAVEGEDGSGDWLRDQISRLSSNE